MKKENTHHQHKILTLEAKWYDKEIQLAKWSEVSTKILKSTFISLRTPLIKNLGAYCMNLKGRGGVKGSIRCVYTKMESHHFIARLDIKSFYGSISHEILLRVLNEFNISSKDNAVVKDYIEIPDTKGCGLGIVAGGSLSTLLGAVYLNPLDKALAELYKKEDIFYLRYVDDIIIMAKT